MYKYNKRQPQSLKIGLGYTLALVVGVVIGYTAFVWGFNRGAVKYAPIECGLQLHEWVK